MRMYTLHQDELHDSIYLGWLTAKIITRYNFGNQIGLLKLTVEFAYRKHHLSTCTRSAHDATVFENWYSLNCCISRKGFTTTDSITADTVIEFLDTFSFQVRKNTFVVLDNATVHRNHKVKALRPIWGEKRAVSFLPTSVLSSFKYCRNALANIEGEMDKSARLCQYWYTFLCHQSHFGSSRGGLVH